jgi:hypothetical protein
MASSTGDQGKLPTMTYSFDASDGSRRRSDSPSPRGMSLIPSQQGITAPHPFIDTKHLMASSTGDQGKLPTIKYSFDASDGSRRRSDSPSPRGMSLVPSQQGITAPHGDIVAIRHLKDGLAVLEACGSGLSVTQGMGPKDTWSELSEDRGSISAETRWSRIWSGENKSPPLEVWSWRGSIPPIHEPCLDD